MRSIHAAVVAAALAGLGVAGCSSHEPERVTERVVYIREKPLPPVSPAPVAPADRPMPQPEPQTYVYGPPAPQTQPLPPVTEVPPDAPIYQPAPPSADEMTQQPTYTESTVVEYVDRPVYVETPYYQPYPVYVGYRGWYSNGHHDDGHHDHDDGHHDHDGDHHEDHRTYRPDDHRADRRATPAYVPTAKQEWPTTPDHRTAASTGTVMNPPHIILPADQSIRTQQAPIQRSPISTQRPTPAPAHAPTPAPAPVRTPDAPMPVKQQQQQDNSSSGKSARGSDSGSRQQQQQDPRLPPGNRKY